MTVWKRGGNGSNIIILKLLLFYIIMEFYADHYFNVMGLWGSTGSHLGRSVTLMFQHTLNQNANKELNADK
jgi:hypothetical protein